MSRRGRVAGAAVDLWRAVVATSPFDEAARPPARERPAGPADLRRARRTVEFSTRNAGDVHARLRPALVDVARARLGTRRGVDLVAQPEAAHALLGDDLWELVRPERPAPDDPFAPGLALERIEAMIATLEDL